MPTLPIPQPEIDTKEVPITIETAHQFFSKRQMNFIVKLYKSVYKEGFLNGRKLIVLLLFSISSFAQSEIVIGSGSLGNGNFVIGGNIIDTPLLYENKFTKPKPIPIIPRPKTRGKYKKSEAQKLKESLKKKK